MRITPLLALAPLLAFAGAAAAATPAEIVSTYQAAAAGENPGFTGFSADRGRLFFNSRHGSDWSCASCHTTDPRQAGRHAVTGKTIAPMATAVNPERFTDTAKVEKWFRRNCQDVLQRECSAQEKGDFIAWLSQAR